VDYARALQPPHGAERFADSPTPNNDPGTSHGFSS
jgi:hypothetical protein